MDKKKLWITGGIVAAMIPIIVVLCLYAFVWNREEAVEYKTTPTANGGTIVPADDTAALVAIQPDGTSASDAIYEFKSKYGYSLRYNNKYTVDLSGKTADFIIRNDSDTVSVAITQMNMDESVANIQTKEEWDMLMGSMLGECLGFKRMPVNNMDALVAHYNIEFENAPSKDVIYAMLIGDDYIYNYIYTAQAGASEAEINQIGAVLYTMVLN